MRFACRRCDWHPDPEDTYGPAKVQLAAHATETEHWCCIVCHRSLAATEIQTCTECVATVRKHLVEILERYALLPGELGHATAAPLDGEGGHRDDETPLPGGTVLALLAGGSEGTQWRGRARESQLAARRTPWRSIEALRVDNPLPWPATPEAQAAHARSVTWAAAEVNDNRNPGDTVSAAFELGRWEDVWREERNEPAAMDVGTVAGAVNYLAGHRLTWAGSHLSAFDEFADDVRGLHHSLTRAVAMDDKPQVGVKCFEPGCGANLIRGYGDAWPCRHRPQPLTLRILPDLTVEPTEKNPYPTRLETVLERDTRLLLQEVEHERCIQGGRVQHYTCTGCHKEYDEQAYHFAVRADYEAEKARRDEKKRLEAEGA